MAAPTADIYTVAAGVRTVRMGFGAPLATLTSKYRFQQDLLFQRAHALTIPAQYVNSLGQTIAIPSMDRTTNRLQGGSQNCGTTPDELCVNSYWKWVNTGGDWLDATLTPQGPNPWATSSLVPVLAGPGEILIDVTAAVQRCDAESRWYAFVLSVAAGQVNITGPCNTTADPKSVLEIVRGGITESKPLWYVASSRTSTSATDAQDPTVALKSSGKTFLEFFRQGADQSVPITSALLRLRYSSVTSAATVRVFLVNPEVPDINAQVPGIASQYTLDVGIYSHASVATRLQVLDSTQIEDVIDIHRVAGNYSTPWDGTPNEGHVSEDKWDPYLWGTPGVGPLASIPVPTQAELDAKLPRAVQTATGTKLTGRAWHNMPGGESVKVVTSTQLAALGLPVLAPGLGAFEMRYPGMNIENGQSTTQSTTVGGRLAGGVKDNDLSMYFKPEHCGRVVDGHLRMYIMLGDGWEPDDTSMGWYYFVSDDADTGRWPEEQPIPPTNPTWRAADFSGKFPAGIQQLTVGKFDVNTYVYPTRLDANGVEDTTPLVATGSLIGGGGGGGGYSNTSGIYGYQGRWSFGQGYYKQNHPGPCCGGCVLHVELYDFSRYVWAIPSQTGIGDWENSYKAGPHRGGLGFLYPKRWYCVEMRWKLNTLTLPYAEPPVGTHFMEGGFNVDGFLEWWVDGIPAGTSPAFATRSSRIVDWALQASSGKPFGTLNEFRPMTGVPEEAYMGATAAILQTFYGGRTPCPKDMFVYLNGVVVSNGAYIGPMKGVSRENGGIA